MNHRNAYPTPTTPSLELTHSSSSEGVTIDHTASGGGGEGHMASKGKEPNGVYINGLHPTITSPGSDASSSTSRLDQYSDTETSTHENPYPPRQHFSPRINSPSLSVHVPLLSPDARSTSFEINERLPRTPTASAFLTMLPFASSRARLHPLALIPAWLLGVLFASTFLSNFLSKPLVHVVKSGYASGPDSETEYHAPTVKSNYTLHSSGHLFLHPSSLDPYSPSSPLRDAQLLTAPRGVSHPIHDLVNNATRDWEAKIARQSKTLEQAVKEYKRRYGRKPPKGFDDWFRFAQTNDVVLIDEFDNILRDVLPFYALPPFVVHNRSMTLQKAASTFTMVVKDGQVDIIGAHRKDGRAQDQIGLMKKWLKWSPDVNITMSAHDGPSIILDDRAKQRLATAAAKGTYLPPDQLEEIDEDASLWGFPLSCPANSRLRRAYDGLEINTMPAGPSFIYDHLKTMDMCENPEWQYLHGFTSWPGMRPQVLRPLFSFAKTSLYSDILLTPLEQYWDHEPWDPEWEQKPNNKAIWRGSTTGVWFDRGTWWRSSQRVRLYFMGKDKTGSRLVRFDGVGKESAQGVESIVERNVSTQTLMKRYVDFGFSGKPSQCDVDDGSCAAVTRIIDFQPTIGWNEANEFKYLLDIDGNAWSGRFHRLLQSNSAVLKSTVFPEWYAEWIQPWVHYIPLKVDYSDLFDIMAFFSGDLDGQNGHDAMAKTIADNGKEYAAKYWRFQDMEAYFFRLALEWARCTAFDRSSMDYEG